MNKHTVKKGLIGIGLLALVGAVGAETYYAHDVAQRLKAEENAQQALADEQVEGLDPWLALHADLMRIQQDMNREWAQVMDVSQTDQQGAPVTTGIQLKDEGDDYLVTAELPGAKEKDISINLHGRLLSISSRIQGADKTTNDKGEVVEKDRYSSSFQEAFTLPGPVNAVGMHSDFKDGVLTLTIPKLTG